MEKEALGEDGMREGEARFQMFTYLILWKHQPAPSKQTPEGSFFTAALNGWSQRDPGSWIHHFVDLSHYVLTE